VLEVAEFLDRQWQRHAQLQAEPVLAELDLNRGIFPTRGRSQTLGHRGAVPGSDLFFYKLQYDGDMYFPLGRTFSGRLRAKLGYGDAWGDTNALPFYEHFFAGGFGSVRGFETQHPRPAQHRAVVRPDGAGPLPTTARYGGSPDPFGGNLLVTGGAELIFPLPFIEDDRQFRSVLFLDAGQVFNTQCPQGQYDLRGFRSGPDRLLGGHERDLARRARAHDVRHFGAHERRRVRGRGAFPV
jgi:outer membrane protein insertion porin family